MSSWVVSAFSKTQTKSMPLNPHTADSAGDSFKDFESVFPSSNSSPSPQSSLTTGVLPQTGRKKAISEQRQEKARRYLGAFLKALGSEGLSHSVAPGIGGVVNLPTVAWTASHMANIEPLLEEVCDNNQPELCQGLVAYVLSQKGRKLNSALVKLSPGIGSLMTAYEKYHGIDKKIAGISGDDRFAQARALVDHAKVCHVSLAHYAELVCGDLTRKENFRKALQEVDNDLEWGLSDEEPVEVAVNKVAGKLRA
jgi:hypothetical protein